MLWNKFISQLPQKFPAHQHYITLLFIYFSQIELERSITVVPFFGVPYYVWRLGISPFYQPWIIYDFSLKLFVWVSMFVYNCCIRKINRSNTFSTYESFQKFTISPLNYYTIPPFHHLDISPIQHYKHTNIFVTLFFFQFHLPHVNKFSLFI